MQISETISQLSHWEIPVNLDDDRDNSQKSVKQERNGISRPKPEFNEIFHEKNYWRPTGI